MSSLELILAQPPVGAYPPQAVPLLWERAGDIPQKKKCQGGLSNFWTASHIKP